MEPDSGVCCITRLGPIENDITLEPTLHYRCLATQAEYYAPVSQIVTWIDEGPTLTPPMPSQAPMCVAPVTYPTFSPLHLHHEPTPILPATNGIKPVISPVPAPSPDPNIFINDDAINPASALRRSQRKRKAPDFLRPKFKGKAYVILSTHLPRKQRVSTV